MEYEDKREQKMMKSQSSIEHQPYVGMWVTENKYIRQGVASGKCGFTTIRKFPYQKAQLSRKFYREIGLFHY